eukprot:2109437-Alexandrium_andersonii.AAC.1
MMVMMVVVVIAMATAMPMLRTMGNICVSLRRPVDDRAQWHGKRSKAYGEEAGSDLEGGDDE